MKGYVWDPVKAVENFRKHRVRFADAALSLEDPLGLSTVDLGSWDEERFVFIGADPGGALLVTVYTLRGNVVRLISSRLATRAERRSYEEG